MEQFPVTVLDRPIESETCKIVEKQDFYPAHGHSWARFFHNQEKPGELKIHSELAETFAEADKDEVVRGVKSE